MQLDKVLIACLAASCIALLCGSSLVDAENEPGAADTVVATLAAPAPVKGAKRAKAAQLFKRGSSTVVSMTQDLSKKTDAERGGSLAKVLSSKLTEKGLDKGINAALKKYPAYAAMAPLVHQFKPVVAEHVGNFVDKLSKKKPKPEPVASPEEQQRPAKKPKKSDEKKLKPEEIVDRDEHERDEDHDAEKENQHDHEHEGEEEGEVGAWEKFKNKVGIDNDDDDDDIDERDHEKVATKKSNY